MRGPLRIYVDTSVIGGCFDAEFAPWSRGLIEDFRARRFSPMVSDVTAAEIEKAPPAVQRVFEEILELGATVLAIDRQALHLLGAYQRRRILAPRFRNDMLHIAVATVAAVDALVSWNFRHIVRLDRIRAFNAVNEDEGYGQLAIHSPREVTTHERR
jgi:hypothetical protein